MYYFQRPVKDYVCVLQQDISYFIMFDYVSSSVRPIIGANINHKLWQQKANMVWSSSHQTWSNTNCSRKLSYKHSAKKVAYIIIIDINITEWSYVHVCML